MSNQTRIFIKESETRPMTSKPATFLLADLCVTQSHSRPHTSNDNPHSEAQFKTLKYRPDFPGRFDSIEAARRHCQPFFAWYNEQLNYFAAISLKLKTRGATLW